MEGSAISHGAGNKTRHGEVLARRFEAHDAAGSSWNADRTTAIGGMGRAQQTPRDLYGCTSGGTAGRMSGVERIIRMRKADGFRIDAQAQLGRGGFADDERAGVDKLVHERIGLLCHVGALGMTERSGHAGDVIEVLDRENPAAQAPVRLRPALQIDVRETVLLGA